MGRLFEAAVGLCWGLLLGACLGAVLALLLLHFNSLVDLCFRLCLSRFNALAVLAALGLRGVPELGLLQLALEWEVEGGRLVGALALDTLSLLLLVYLPLASTIALTLALLWLDPLGGGGGGEEEEEEEGGVSGAVLARLPVWEPAAGSEEVCGVCMGSGEPGELWLSLPCRHAFHAAPCAAAWLQYHVKCPLCKAIVQLPCPRP